MNLIARLFGPRPNLAQLTDTTMTGTPSAKENEIPADLFIDENPPASGLNTPVAKNILNEFLDQDYCKIGARDAFNFHSNEMMEARKKEIRSGFLLKLDQAIQEKRSKRLHLQNLFVEMVNVSTELKDQLGNSLEEIDNSISTLQLQKELSAMDEGWVMGPLRQYHTGYLQGMRDYMESEAILSSTNIF